MKKRMLIFAMTMALCLGVFSLTAKADGARAVDSYLGLQSAFVEASRDPNDPTFVTLTRDITTISPMELRDGYMIIDLNGFKIDRALESATENGFVIRVNGGSLTLLDSNVDNPGAITGGYSNSISIGSAVDIIDGEFILYEGNITGNKGNCQVALHSNSSKADPCFIMDGGLISNVGDQDGVRIDKGTFKMSGGMIADSSHEGVLVSSGGNFEMSGDAKICRNRTGVEVYGGNVTMTGGEISGNTYGMTVTTSATYRFSGTPRIIGNKDNQYNEQNLVFNHFSSQGVNGVVYISGPLTDNALIGVYIGIHSTEGTPQIFADGTDGYKITKNDLGKFTSDDIDYSVELNSDSKLQLANDPAEIYDLYVAGTRVTDKNASNLSVIYGVTGKASYDPATNTLNLEGVTINNLITRNYCYGIQYIGTKDFTINSKGNNKISASGSLSEVFSGGIAVGSPGKYDEENKTANLIINIASDSVLTVESGDPTKSNSPKSIGVAYIYLGTVTIKGSGTLNAVGGKAFLGIGLYSAGDVNISGNVTVNAESNGYYFSDGINSGSLFIDGNVNVRTSASDADEGSCGIFSEIICISGGNVTAISGKDTDPSDDGYVDPLEFAGIRASELEIKGENTTVSAKGSGTSIICVDKFKICDPLKIITPKDGVIGSDATGSDRKLIFEADGKTFATDVLIHMFTPAPTKASSASLTLDKKTATVVCGKKLTLKATLKNSNSKISWKSSDTKIATVDGSGKITAKKAGQVTITATAAGKSAKCTVTVLYKDVIDSSEFWYAPTNYLTAKNVVKGYADQTEFRPANDCTRAQMVTFLYRLQGEPKTKSNECKFDDVKSADYFYKPVIWAVEQGITTGVSKTSFKPQGVCTRAQTVTFLWRMAGKPEPKGGKDFSDVKKTDYFYKATLWASDKKILAGYDDGTFKPQGKCLRRQMVTFLYKYDKYINKKG